jgi:hypothetical protein
LRFIGAAAAFGQTSTLALMLYILACERESDSVLGASGQEHLPMFANLVSESAFEEAQRMARDWVVKPSVGGARRPPSAG